MDAAHLKNVTPAYNPGHPRHSVGSAREALTDGYKKRFLIIERSAYTGSTLRHHLGLARPVNRYFTATT